MASCPDGAFANTFDVKFLEWAGGIDDTAVNAVKLFCTDPIATEVTRLDDHKLRYSPITIAF